MDRLYTMAEVIVYSRGGDRMRVYVASSWRNKYQQEVVRQLRAEGFDVYDFRHPAPGDEGFHWSEIDPDWQEWDPATYVGALAHPIAEQGFRCDFAAMKDCDVCLFVLPAGRSASWEAGWFCGQGKPTAVLVPEHVEPELMFKLADLICVDLGEAVAFFKTTDLGMGGSR